MHVVVELVGPARATVQKPNAFDRFNVVVRGSDDPARLAVALEALGIGQLVGDHVLVRREWLRNNADDGTTDWAAGFAAMIGFAQGHGWLSADGESIRAHVVSEPGASATRPITSDPNSAGTNGPGSATAGLNGPGTSTPESAGNTSAG